MLPILDEFNVSLGFFKDGMHVLDSSIVLETYELSFYLYYAKLKLKF